MRQQTYTDKNGHTFVKILNFWALDKKMTSDFGSGWKQRHQSMKTYGHEQLFENQYNSRGRLI